MKYKDAFETRVSKIVSQLNAERIKSTGGEILYSNRVAVGNCISANN